MAFFDFCKTMFIVYIYHMKSYNTKFNLGGRAEIKLQVSVPWSAVTVTSDVLLLSV